MNVCYACGRRGADAARCDCGEPLWRETDPRGFEWPEGPDSMWSYGELLPVDPPTGVGAAAGATPLVRVPGLDEYAGVRVHLKDEGANPTESFKDRGSAVGVSRAAVAGRAVGTVSHGNMAASVAAHAAAHDLECVVLVPADISRERLGRIGVYGPTILGVEGDYGALYRASLELSTDIEFLNSDVPLRVAGQKTTALEVHHALAPDPPDAIVLPASSGGHASAVWKGLRELRAAGLLEDLPRLYLVQAAACAPIAEAFAADAEVVTPVEAGGTVAYSIANPDPPSGTRALAAVRATGGAALAVDDDAIRDAQERFARSGFAVETASATTLAGARRLATEGLLSTGDRVVLVATGTGVPEAATGGPVPDVETVAIEDLGTRLTT